MELVQSLQGTYYVGARDAVRGTQTGFPALALPFTASLQFAIHHDRVKDLLRSTKDRSGLPTMRSSRVDCCGLLYVIQGGLCNLC